MNLIIRKNGKYLQVGYNYKKRWNLVYHIGTIEKLLELVGIPIPEEYQKLKREIALEKMK